MAGSEPGPGTLMDMSRSGTVPRNPERRARRARRPAVLAGGVVYFLVVFAWGFLLGVVRTLWLVPRLGERWAELVEVPVMLGVIWLAARWVVRRFSLGARGRGARAGVGLLALALLLAAELGFVLRVRGLSLVEYLEERDPVSGTAYVVSLALFAILPVVVSPRDRSR